MIKKLFILSAGLILGVLSCKVDPKISVPLPANDLVVVAPAGWPQPVYNFSANPITQNTFILGRSLFYETLLSKDNTISCALCHQNYAAFANAGHKVSHGYLERLGTRNAPALFNLTFHPYFMHDGGIPNIEKQPIAPMTNTLEMCEDIADIVTKLQASAKYQDLFKQAYGSSEITSQGMLKALAQFMGLMYSYNSKYDYFKRHENNVQLTDAEARGYALFLGKCNSCHAEPLFTDFQFRNNGLKIDPNINDSGRAHVTGLAEDRYKFKTPSLRNIGLSGPYMHNGSLETLNDCLDHYTGGIVNTINLDPLLQNGIQMSAQDKQDIISFLQTLSDYQFINDKRFTDPNQP